MLKRVSDSSFLIFIQNIRFPFSTFLQFGCPILVSPESVYRPQISSRSTLDIVLPTCNKMSSKGISRFVCIMPISIISPTYATACPINCFCRIWCTGSDCICQLVFHHFTKMNKFNYKSLFNKTAKKPNNIFWKNRILERIVYYSTIKILRYNNKNRKFSKISLNRKPKVCTWETTQSNVFINQNQNKSTKSKFMLVRFLLTVFTLPKTCLYEINKWANHLTWRS